MIDRSRFFTRRLLRWYRARGRDLPWRRTSDPYAIWISEIMLQQTQVASVLPYYHRFLSAFPTVQDLADAPFERVLKCWEGLGYYARARHLHLASKEIINRFDGEIPPVFDDILSLPGIGRSTAGAILTIAYGQRRPILDGNVRRVLCRYFLIEKDPRKKEVEAWLWGCAERILPRRGADIFTQGIMDLGATICTPTLPRCTICPLHKGCDGYQKGVQETLPVRRERKNIPHFDYVAGVILCGSEVLIRRRPMKGLLAGLWEFPGGRIDSLLEGRTHERALETILKREMNFHIRVLKAWVQIRHAFTHFRMTLHVFICRVKKQRVKDSHHILWLPVEKLADHPFSSAHQKVAVRLAQEGSPSGIFVKDKIRPHRQYQLK